VEDLSYYLCCSNELVEDNGGIRVVVFETHLAIPNEDTAKIYL
jgi:hypothetical protein